MTDMRGGRLMQGGNGDHTARTLRVRVAHGPPPPVARKLSYPSWKVIVSASHGQYLKPGSYEPGFFFASIRRSVAWMERSEIRVPALDNPGLRCAPSGLQRHRLSSRFRARYF